MMDQYISSLVSELVKCTKWIETNGLSAEFIGICVAVVVAYLAIPALDIYFQGHRGRDTKWKALMYVGNASWLFTGGIILWALWVSVGVALLCSLVFAPIGMQILKLNLIFLLPYGRELKDDIQNSSGRVKEVYGVAWFFVLGFLPAVYHIIAMVVCAWTLVLIPHAVQHHKLCKISAWIFKFKIVLSHSHRLQAEAAAMDVAVHEIPPAYGEIEEV
eukprot:TRINITY_DN521_c0_g1_i1.p1 TRINITY_DN521_c0_g1~~TRINITY_DN521_c0_g1_i1.p1  ORF type:complete len:217 (-),score=43.16 TRINITY_DN521_c0_g1_i1:54-704(-)